MLAGGRDIDAGADAGAGHAYRPGVDGLRAIAVAAVLGFHLDRLPGGNLGVDAFFVISGWLITWKLLESTRGGGSVRLVEFWGARVRRLLPASLTLLLTVSIVWPMVGIDVASLRHDVIWAALWMSNWGTIRSGGDYWSRFGEPSPITHFWSLAIEEQFYLVWPVVLAVLVRLRRGRLAVGLTALTLSAGSIALMLAIADPHDPTATYMNTFARGHSLLIGAAAATITSTLPNGRLRGGALARRAAPVAAAVALAIVAMSGHGSMWLFRWGFPTFALAMTIVVVAAADGMGGRVLASAPARWLADRSYGLYLWHWPVFLLLSPTRIGFGGPAADVLKVGLAVVIADLSYRFLERPIRRAKRPSLQLLPLMAGIAVLVVVVVAGVVVPSAPGTEAASIVTLPSADLGPSNSVRVASLAPAPTTTSRAPDTTTRAPNPLAPTATIDPTATSTAQTTVVVPAIDPTVPMRVLVTGDSTAQKLADALIPDVAAHSTSLLVGSAAFPGCGLSAGADGRRHEFTNEGGTRELVDISGCLTQWDGVTTRVAGAEQIDVVLVDIGPWDAVDIHLADGSVVSIADPAGRALVASAYRHFVERVQAAGATIVWVTPPDAHIGWGASDDPLNDPSRWTALREVIDSLGVRQIDLRGWLAQNGLDGPDGRPDGVHLAPAVNQRFIDEVVIPALDAVHAGG